MPKHFYSKMNVFYTVITGILIFLFLHLALNCYFADSEIWLLTLSQKVFNPEGQVSIYYKYLFHLFTKAGTYFANTNVDTYIHARLSFAFLSILTLILNAFVFIKIFDNKKLFLPLLFFTLSSSLFFNQAFRVRADILATFFHCIYLLVFLYTNEPSRKTTVLLSILNVLMFCSTPKAILFTISYVALGLLYYNRPIDSNSKKKSSALIFSALIPLQILLLFFVVLAFAAPQHQLLYSFQSATDFYLKSFDQSLGGAAFFKKSDFMYFFRFLRQSWAHSFLMSFWILSFVYSAFFKKIKNDLQHTFNVYSATLFLLIICYNQKLPFFLGPFLTPIIAFQVCLFYQWTNKHKLLRPVFFLAIATAFVTSFGQYKVNIFYNDNKDQMKFISELEEYKFLNSQIKIFDVIGLLPKSNTYYYFIGPGEVSRREAIFSSISKEPPDIYLYTYKNNFFEPMLSSFLNQNYFELSPGVWLKSINYNLAEDTKSIDQVVSINKKKYWLMPILGLKKIFNTLTKEEITADCLFLDSKLSVSKTEIAWVAVPFLNHRFSLVGIPSPSLTKDPNKLFRFDTSF
jgi:hypothetical protein